MTRLINPIRQPRLDISLIWIPLLGMRLPTVREDKTDMTSFVGFYKILVLELSFERQEINYFTT
jgi:hypothetical protein